MKRFLSAAFCILSATTMHEPLAARAADEPAYLKGVPLIPRQILFGNPEKAAARISPDGKRLAYLAPVSLRARDLPRLLLRGARGSGLKDDRTLVARDVDRLVVRCDEPLPLQVDGEDTGDVREVVYESERDAVTVFV